MPEKPKAGEVIAPPPPEDMDMERTFRAWAAQHPSWYGKAVWVGWCAGWRARSRYEGKQEG